MGGSSEDSFVEPLGILLGFTAIAALVLSFARQSTIVAFILVGLIVSAFGYSVDATVLGHFSEVGILVLLFMAGLEVEIHAFIEQWRDVTVVGLGQIVLWTGLNAGVAQIVLPAVGQQANGIASVYFGLAMCFSSTILVLGFLKKSKSMDTVYGRLCLGTLILQDVASVLGLAVLSGLGGSTGTCSCRYAAGSVNASLCAKPAGGGDACASVVLPTSRQLGTSSYASNSSNATAASVCTAFSAACTYVVTSDGGIMLTILTLLGKLVVACIIFALLAKFVLPRLFELFADSLELLFLGSIGYCTGMAALAILAGFSAEITAFLAGVSVSQLEYKLHMESKLEPIKAIGVAIFFLSLGLQIPLNQTLIDALPLGIGLAIFTIIATLPLFLLLGWCAGLKAHNCFIMGILMNQISEFSLILCTLCVRAGVLDRAVLTVLTVAAVSSIIVSSIGHIFIDELYAQVQRHWLLCLIDDRYRRAHQHGLSLGGDSKDKPDKDSPLGKLELVANGKSDTALLPASTKGTTAKGTTTGIDTTTDSNGITSADDVYLDNFKQLLSRRPSGLLETEWSFEAQLPNRTTEQLVEDLRLVEAELETARKGMAEPAMQGKGHRHHKSSLYGQGFKKALQGLKIATSHARDIRHGLIEGYVVMEGHLTFCTLREGRMLFWDHQHDVGHTPPKEVWDVSGMMMLDTERESDAIDRHRRTRSSKNRSDTQQTKTTSHPPNDVETGEDIEEDDEDFVDFYVNAADRNEIEDADDDEFHPWEWTIVLAHIHRSHKAVSSREDPMKLCIHGLLDHSDHDFEDWRDALAVALATLNPIALRRAHIKEELNKRRRREEELTGHSRAHSRSISYYGRVLTHNHRNEIICLGYNEMFPAVLALADGIDKQVVMVDYDPQKMNVVKKRYNETQRNQDADEEKLGGSKVKGKPVSSEDKNSDKRRRLKGVACRYADIHDPEMWEELDLDRAFMVICCMHGAHHAEKAIVKWLRKHGSDTIFITCSGNNMEALQLYKAGAHFVLQTDALAMRSTKEIFLEMVAEFGDCSQLVVAGQAHEQRLRKLRKDDELRFLYETG
eukprot:g1563.t1